MTLRALLLSAILLTTTTAAAATTTYRYYGIHPTRGPVTLQLDQANVTQGHIAVWFGANDTHSYWVQAGVAQVEDAPPFTYIETAHHGEPTLQNWPAQLHHPYTIRLVTQGGRWAATIQHHRSKWVWLRDPITQTMLETYGDATGTAHINHHTVSTP